MPARSKNAPASPAISMTRSLSLSRRSGSSPTPRRSAPPMAMPGRRSPRSRISPHRAPGTRVASSPRPPPPHSRPGHCPQRSVGCSLASRKTVRMPHAPTVREDGALTAALRRLRTRLEEDSSIAGRLDVDETLPTLSAEVEVALLRTAQSVLANVRQHSQATRVMVSLMDHDGAIRMDIVDDGVGMADPHNRQRNPDSGFGRDVIGSRMRELGGELVIESSPGSGFAISATLPGQSQLHTRGAGLSTADEGPGTETAGRLGEGDGTPESTDTGESA